MVEDGQLIALAQVSGLVAGCRLGVFAARSTMGGLLRSAALLQPVALQQPVALLRSVALISMMLLTAPLASWAESSTAESIWDESNARERALQQVPQGATVSATTCESISVGMGNTRYRCTVTFTPAPPATPKAP